MSEIVATGIIQAGTLREYIQTFTPLVSEGKVHFNDDGLTIRVIEPATVAMIHPGHIHARAFESYESPGAATIGVDFTSLMEKIGPASKDDLIELAVDMETRKLRIRYGNATQHMGLIDPDSIRQEPDRPDIELPNSVTVTGGDLSDAIKIVDLASDHVEVRADPEDRVMSFHAQGDIDDADVSFGDEDLVDGKVTTETSSLFSIEYLECVTGPIPDGADVEIRFGDEYPAWFEWAHPDGHFEISTMVAPRIQSH